MTRIHIADLVLTDDPGGRLAWRIWLEGYERGLRSGHDTGYTQAMAERFVRAGDDYWNDRPQIGHPPAPQYPHEPLTAAQIAANATASWAETRTP